MMKKCLIFLLVVITAFLLTSCAPASEVSPTTSNNNEVKTQKTSYYGSFKLTEIESNGTTTYPSLAIIEKGGIKVLCFIVDVGSYHGGIATDCDWGNESGLMDN